MAKILISYFSDYGEAMYDAISDILLKNGNDVFRFNINNPAVSITKWGGDCSISDKSVIKQITDFAPEIVLNFNHSLPLDLYNILNNTCKICIIDADNPETFWNKDFHLKNKKNYIYLGLQSYSKTMYEQYINQKINGKYLYFPPATVVQNKKLKQDKNVSFIGSNFYPLQIPYDEKFYTNEALKLYNAFKENYYLTFKEAKKIYSKCSENLFELIRAFYVGQDRLKYMQQLEDLGLTFYGVRWWNHIAYYDFELAKCFDATPKTSIEDNQWVYNTSKISVNISHPQAKSSFSWRVMDIMASGACLLMEDKPDWKDLFAKYLSKDVLDTIIYKDRFDMRQKAIKLLSDEDLRLKCVKELNNAIEQNGRWEVRFKDLEKFLGIKLLNLPTTGKYIVISRDEKPVKVEDSLPKQHKNIFQKLKMKKRYKLFVYSQLLALCQIPLLDMGIRHKHRDKLLQKINKYWR